MPLSMPHIIATLSPAQTVDLIKDYGLIIRWDSDFDSSKSYHWWHLIKDKKEELSELNSNIRKIFRCYKSFDIKKIDRSYVIDGAYQIYADFFL